MRRRVFIGSSTEARKDLDMIAEWLQEDGLDPVPWNKPGEFELGNFVLPQLLEKSTLVDGAVLIFTPDDRTWFRNSVADQPRDNVILEYGIFVSKLGQKAAIICHRDDPKIAIDLKGLITLDISKDHEHGARREFSEWTRLLPSAIAGEEVVSPTEAGQLIRTWLSLGLRDTLIVSRLERLRFSATRTYYLLTEIKKSG